MLNKSYLYLLLFSVIFSFLTGCGGSSSTTVIIPTPQVTATFTPTAATPSPTSAAATPTPTPGGSGNKIFFLHHSVGNDLIERGNVRGTIDTYNSSHGTGYQFWDHGYNGDGLRDSSGNFTGTNYAIPGDNTDPDGLSYLFTSSGADAVSARNQIMTYNVIAFKSCFTASQALVDDDTLNNYKNYYLQMRNYFDAHPEKVFVVITPPPSHPDETDSAAAARARQFANWLKSSEYLSGHSNIVCFDLFDYFADSNNVLKAGYRYTGEVNSHPNELGDQTVGPIFAQFLIDNAR